MAPTEERGAEQGGKKKGKSPQETINKISLASQRNPKERIKQREGNSFSWGKVLGKNCLVAD